MGFEDYLLRSGPAGHKFSNSTCFVLLTLSKLNPRKSSKQPGSRPIFFPYQILNDFMSAMFKDLKPMYWLVLGEPSIGLILSLQLTLQLYNWQLVTTIHQPGNHLTPVSYPLAKVSDTTLTNLNHHQSSQGGLLIPTNPLYMKPTHLLAFVTGTLAS